MEQVIIDAVSGVVDIVLLALISIAAAWFQRKLKSERLLNALHELGQAASDTVGELQQVTVEGLKAASRDGKLSSDEIDELKRQSMALITRRMSASARKAIETAGLDLQDLMRAKVQSAVTSMKKAS